MDSLLEHLAEISRQSRPNLPIALPLRREHDQLLVFVGMQPGTVHRLAIVVEDALAAIVVPVPNREPALAADSRQRRPIIATSRHNASLFGGADFSHRSAVRGRRSFFQSPHVAADLPKTASFRDWRVTFVAARTCNRGMTLVDARSQVNAAAQSLLVIVGMEPGFVIRFAVDVKDVFATIVRAKKRARLTVRKGARPFLNDLSRVD